LQLSERNGRMMGALQVMPDQDLMMITRGGTLMRTGVDQISVVSRNTQGVRLMKVEDGDVLLCLATVERMPDAVETPETTDAAADAAGEDSAAAADPVEPTPDAPADEA
jgi:DNA gyrase subunit A